jgi:hypothetical protein
VLDAFGLDRDDGMAVMLNRLWRTLRIDGSVDPEGLAQMNVVCYCAQRFFVLWRRHLQQPSFLRHRLEVRDQGTRLLTSLSHMEKIVWSAREVDEVMRIVADVQDGVRQTLMLLDRGR